MRDCMLNCHPLCGSILLISLVTYAHEPANCYRSLKLCTVVLYMLKYRKIQGVKKFKWGHTHFGHAHLSQLTCESKNHNSASEGRTESVFSSKEPQ